MRIVIYQISEKEKVIYNLGKLLEQLCTKEEKIGILCDKDNIEDLDKELWTFSTNAFVPHDVVITTNNKALKINKETIENSNNSANTEIEENNSNEMQPVLLASDLEVIRFRKIICVLNENDLLKVLNFSRDNYNNATIINNIIYMTNKNIESDFLDSINNFLKQDVNNDNTINRKNDYTIKIYKKEKNKWSELKISDKNLKTNVKKNN